MKTNCLICSKDSLLIKSLEKSSIYKCGSCQFEFAHPMPTKEELQELYTGYRYYSQYNEEMVDTMTMKNADKNIKYLKKYGLTKESRLLDFGCGKDLFVKQGCSKNWIGYNYPIGKMPDGKFDFISLWGVLEHLSDPVGIIKTLNSKLNKNGKIVMTTVGTETGIPYRYRFPVHLVWWSKKSVEKLFSQTQFKTKEISNYYVFQNPDFYLDRVLDRGRVPDELKKIIHTDAKDYIIVPTNEIFIVGEKK